MKVDAYGNIKATNATKKRSGLSATSDFSSVLSAAESEETTQNSGLQEIADVSTLSGIIALQEVPEQEVRRKKLIKHGENLLEQMEQLRRRLLMGTLSTHLLHDINRELEQQKQEINDPRLLEIIADIELRAAVEAAKLEMAQKNHLL